MFSRNVRLFLLGVFLTGLGMTFWNLLFNLYLQEGGYSKPFIGNILAYGNIAVAAAALPAAYLAGRVGIRTQMVVMQLLSSVAFGLAAMAEQAHQLVLFVVLAFAFSTFVRVVGGPFIMRNSTKVERTYIFSTLFLIMLAGGVLGNAMGGWIKDLLVHQDVAALLAYRYTILIGVGLSFLGVIPFLFLRVQPESPDEPKLRLAGWREWDWRLFGKAVFPILLLATGAGLIVQFLNLYFKDVFHTPDKQIGVYMAIQAATMVIGLLLAPALSERFGKVNTIVTTQLISLPFMLVLAFTDYLPLAIFAFVMRAVLMNMSWPLANTLMLEMCRKEEQPILNGLFTTAWSLAWAFSAYLYGEVLQADYTACFLIAAVLYVMSSAAYYLFFKDAERQLAEDAASTEPVKTPAPT